MNYIRLLQNCYTNEQRLQIIKFHYQNACSVKKVHRTLLPLYDQFSRPTAAAIRVIVTKCRTKLNSYVEYELKKISQLNRPVLMMAINYLLITVRSNWATVTQQRGKFC